jgi:hypothetical protein
MEILRSAVRPIVTLLISAGIVAGFFLGKLSAEQFMSVAMLVVGFYFVDRSASKKQGG